MNNIKEDNIIPLFFWGLHEASPPAQYALAFTPNTLLYINAMRLRSSRQDYSGFLLPLFFRAYLRQVHKPHKSRYFHQISTCNFYLKAVFCNYEPD